jgi:hypothetical protein
VEALHRRSAENQAPGVAPGNTAEPAGGPA